MARWLNDKGHEAEHVMDIGLQAAKDREVWQAAREREAVVISKDDDFLTLVTLYPEQAQVVWIRSGNTTKQALLDWFSPLLPAVIEALQAGERLVEVKGGQSS